LAFLKYSLNNSEHHQRWVTFVYISTIAWLHLKTSEIALSLVWGQINRKITLAIDCLFGPVPLLTTWSPSLPHSSLRPRPQNCPRAGDCCPPDQCAQSAVAGLSACLVLSGRIGKKNFQKLGHLAARGCVERSVTTNWLSVSASVEILTRLLGSRVCNRSENIYIDFNLKIFVVKYCRPNGLKFAFQYVKKWIIQTFEWLGQGVRDF
jgi:hypothetical protein